MKLTKEFLRKHEACSEGYEWYCEHGCDTVEETIDKLIEHGKYHWANWLITRCLEKKDCVRYAIYAAKKVLYIFEENYPSDKRPREAIEAAKKYLAGKITKYNLYVARAAICAAVCEVARAAEAAAAYAAYSAVYVSYEAVDEAVYEALDSLSAYASYESIYAAEIKKDIIRYGIKLLNKENT